MGPKSSAPGTSPVVRLRKMVTSFSFPSLRLIPIRNAAFVAACLAVLLLLVSSGSLTFLTESDEQFLERQRLYRRMRDLSRLRNERRRRHRLNHANMRDKRRRNHNNIIHNKNNSNRHNSNNSNDNSLSPSSSAASNTAARTKDYYRHQDTDRSTLHARATPPKDVIPAEKQDAPEAGIQKRPGPSPTPASHSASSTSSRSTSHLQIYWDDDASENRICRIQRACVAKDGAVVVPAWMARHAEVLESCGIMYVRYMKSDSDWNTNGTYGDYDLFGYKPLRYHIPHFVTDLLPVLYAHEVLRPTFSPLTTKRRSCLQPAGLCTDKVSDALAKERLNIALYTDERVATMKADAWVPMLIGMMPSRPTLAFPKTIFSHADTACFRSVVAYAPHSYVRPWRGWYGPRQALFARNHISRQSAIRPPPPGKHHCNVQLTILNRFGWVERGGYLVGRDIVNVDEIMAQLEILQKERTTTTTGGAHYPPVKLDVSVEYFENTDFREQVAVMQKADVILGVHGAGLGNLLFARMDVPFVEVFPMGYYAGPFDRLAEALNLKYRYVVADPDTKNFYHCIEKRAKALDNPDILAKALSMWKNALTEWKQGATRVLNSHEWRGKILAPIKLCIRSQRMRLRPKETAKVLLELADGICERPS